MTIRRSVFSPIQYGVKNEPFVLVPIVFGFNNFIEIQTNKHVNAQKMPKTAKKRPKSDVLICS